MSHMDLNIAEQAEKVTILSPPGLSGSYSQKSAGILPKYDLMPGRENCRPSAPKALIIELPRGRQLDCHFCNFWSRTPKQCQKRVPERFQNSQKDTHLIFMAHVKNTRVLHVPPNMGKALLDHFLATISDHFWYHSGHVV